MQSMMQQQLQLVNKYFINDLLKIKMAKVMNLVIQELLFLIYFAFVTLVPLI